MTAPRRLPSETFRVRLPVTAHDGTVRHHEIDVSLAYHPISGRLREIVFVSRGKIGSGLDILFSDLGVALSRGIQGRDPETGEGIKP